MKKYVFIFTLIMIFSSCIIDPPVNNDPVDETKYGYVTPSAGKLGTKVKFFQLDETDYPIEEYRILFNGMTDLIVPDSVTSAGIFTTVPFSALHGPIKIVHYELDSTDFSNNGVLLPMINCDTVNINYFDVTEYSSHIDIRLTWFNLNYTITPEHAKYRSGKIENVIDWQGEVKGDTTWISASYTIDDTHYTHSIGFYSIRGNDILPELMFVRSEKAYTKFGVDYVDRDYFFEGVVKLQTWKPGELVSGRVITTLGNMNNFHFWCDFSE